MGIFDRFESIVEKGVNTAFSKMFRSGLQAVDISSALHRVMDDSAGDVVPNQFIVTVSEKDYRKIRSDDEPQLIRDLTRDVTAYADEEQKVLAGPITISFEPSSKLTAGTLEVQAEVKRGTAAPATGSAPSPDHPLIDVGGEKWLLTEEITVIGRSSKADITVDDAGVSRQHVEFRVTPEGVIITDLSSTNGTFVEGNRVEAATLLDGNEITIGRTRIMFWTHPG